MEATEPSKLTINQLKSALTENGFIDKIPQNERKSKAYYVGMYKEYVLPILERQRAAKRRSDPAQLRDLVDSLPEEKSKQEAKRRQTVAVGKIASLSQAIKTEPAPLPKFEPAVPVRAAPLPPVSSVYPAPGSPLYPSPISHQPPYSSFAPVETRPVLASATPPRKASPVVSRESSPALRSRESSPALRQRPASPARPSESEDEIEITEEFYVDEDEHQREYRSAFLNCILVSIVLATVLGISLFLLPSLVRVPFIADNLDSWIPFGSGNQPPYYCLTGTLPSPIPSNPSRNCTRCPLYGICLGGELRCGSGYVKERSKIEGKYVERCVRDEEEVRQMNDLREKIRGMLSEHAGGHECGTEGYTEPGLSQEVLRDKLFTEYLSSKGGRKDDPDRIRAFDKLFLGVMREFLLHPEYNVIIKDGQWSSTDKALPLICEMKQRLWELKWYLLFSLVVAAAIQGLLWKRSKRNTENQEAEAMVEEVKKLLSQQKEASRQNDRIPPFLPLVHVRDTLFHDNIDRKNKFSQKERLALWDRVVRLVSEDRRIRTTPQMVEGEQQATWEWVSKLITS